ncbi:flagellar hook-length control protein FliK [Planobispora siamensis]|uniref:flagellar hook-length control protein FliK n=1 Tax=Planobispora siamensis TaxID=936338 RepID=UPI0019509A47|nr:flagellar hook-length control protein FliK [Planobispora siamensis]
MPSIPLAGSPSPMAAPSGSSGEGQTGQNGAGDAFAALLALLAGGGVLPQGVTPPGPDTSAGANGTGANGAAPQGVAPASAGPLQAQALTAALGQAQPAVQPQPGLQEGVPAFPAQPGTQAQGQTQASTGTAIPAALLTGAGAETVVMDGATLAAFTAAADAARQGQDALAAQPAVTAPATTKSSGDVPSPQIVADQTVAVAPTGAGTGAGSGSGAGTTGDDGSGPSASATGAVTETADPVPQAAPQSFATVQAAAVERVAAPAAQQPATPASQIAVHVVPLRQDPDGIHRLTIHLHPVDLGPVSVVAELRNGAVHLQLAGTSDAAFDALRSALPDLKRELEESGFSSCSLDLQREAPNGGQPGDRNQPFGRQDPAARAAAGAARAGDAYQRPEPAVTDPVPDRPGSRLLNVRL